MCDQPETIAEIIADFRRHAKSLSGLMPLTTRLGEEHFTALADRIEAAYKREFGNTQIKEKK